MTTPAQLRRVVTTWPYGIVILLPHTKNQLLSMSRWRKCETPKFHLAGMVGTLSTGSFRLETELREGIFADFA